MICVLNRSTVMGTVVNLFVHNDICNRPLVEVQ